MLGVGASRRATTKPLPLLVMLSTLRRQDFQDVHASAAALDRLGQAACFVKRTISRTSQHAVAEVQPSLLAQASHGPGLSAAPCYGCHPSSAGVGRDLLGDL